MIKDSNKAHIINSIANFVQSIQLGEGSGHDWWHTYRVWKLSITICRSEKADQFVVELAALLHDIADHKFNDGNLSAGRSIVSKHLSSLNVDIQIINSVNEIIENISYKGANVKEIELSIEGKVVQDADRLDAIGAIGIARAFAYGGYKEREIYNPEIKPQMHSTFENYRKSSAPSINHFYEKLLLLKDRMHTETAKEIAARRHQFMEQYLDHFFNEWEGE